MNQRRSGLLLHPTSLPGPFAVGDMGPAAYHFLDWLEAAGQSVWQVLPLNATAFGNSPYGPVSVFAGNPLLISPELLVADGLLAEADLTDPLPGAAARVDYDAAGRWKSRLLRVAWESFRRRGGTARLLRFCEQAEQAYWLDDWALFAALKERQGGAPWSQWPAALRQRRPAELDAARRELAPEIDYHRFAQYLFFSQWEALRREAGARGVLLLGDLPIYTALDSADVWAHPELFDLDPTGRPRHVAGVPPDYFSATGQLWGNPLYRWDRMRETGYSWWIERMRTNFRLADWVRIDHFRGLAAYWEVEASERTAEAGVWRPGPGGELFDALREALGELPLVAEDLGVITPDVERLRRGQGLPGMKVLQFGFGEIGSSHAPHRFEPDTVVYTGTHDNDTTLGWFASADDPTRRRAVDYLGAEPASIHHALLRAAWTSVATVAVAPLQDLLGLGSEARMNTPGQGDGNWAWRLSDETLLSDELARWLHRLTEVAERLVPTAGSEDERDHAPAPG